VTHGPLDSWDAIYEKAGSGKWKEAGDVLATGDNFLIVQFFNWVKGLFPESPEQKHAENIKNHFKESPLKKEAFYYANNKYVIELNPEFLKEKINARYFAEEVLGIP
jgi:hypothetical protein